MKHNKKEFSHYEKIPFLLLLPGKEQKLRPWL